MKLTDQEKIDIVNEYTNNNTTYSKLAKKYNVSPSAIYGLLKRRNIKGKSNKKYQYDENYFDEINTENKAYWLGLLYADGYNNQQKNVIKLQLQEKDITILQKFNNDLKSNRQLSFIEHKTKHPTWQNQWLLMLYSKHMCNQLAKLGCFQNKSLTLQFPSKNQVPSYLIKHFLRGLWDGDGSITLYYVNNTYKVKRPVMCSCLVSTLDMCENIKKILKKEININCYICKGGNNKRLKISGTQQVYKLMTWLYGNSSLFIDRKFEKFKKCIEIMENEGSSFNQ